MTLTDPAKDQTKHRNPVMNKIVYLPVILLMVGSHAYGDFVDDGILIAQRTRQSHQGSSDLTRAGLSVNDNRPVARVAQG